MKSRRGIRIITNNPQVLRCLSGHYEVTFLEEACKDLLIRARDLIFLGHHLCAHPMAGSMKPYESPYKSLVISETADACSAADAALISAAVAAYEKFPTRNRILTEKVLADFQTVDYALLCSALDLEVFQRTGKEDVSP